MQTIDIAYDGVNDLVITVNGAPVWASNTATRAAAGPAVAPLPGSSGADPDLNTALRELTDQHGIVAVQHMIRTIRHNDNGPTVSSYLSAEAAKEIADLLKRRPNITYAEARLAIATRWGYTGTSIPNFNKIADRGWNATQSGGAG